VTDHGPNDATNISLQDLLPAGMSFVSAAPSQGTYDPATGLWTIGGVASGSSAVLLMQAQVVGAADTLNDAAISHADQFDPNPGNNPDSVLVTPQQADLSVTKAVSDAAPNVGDVIEFVVAVGNAGANDATGVTVQDVLPAGLAFVSATVT